MCSTVPQTPPFPIAHLSSPQQCLGRKECARPPAECLATGRCARNILFPCLCAAVRPGEHPVFPGRDWSYSLPFPPLWPRYSQAVGSSPCSARVLGKRGWVGDQVTAKCQEVIRPTSRLTRRAHSSLLGGWTCCDASLFLVPLMWPMG